MNILRQLWQDAQSVLRDMSVTQRVAVTFLVLTVAVWLTFAAWMGTTPGETGRRPLPMDVEPASVNEVLTQLKSKGIKTAEYDYDARRIVVSVDEEKNAVIALAEDGLLKDAHEFGFVAMLDKWSFSDPTKKSDEAMRLARANEVARLVENLDVIKEAQVIYSDDAKNSLFGVAHKKTASVRVKTALKRELTDEIANTIIALVASAKAGLDPRDVVVTDQMGRKFHSQSGNTLNSMGRQKWETEFALGEEMRRTLENLIRQYIPNIEYDGVVSAFPKLDVTFDYKEELHKEVLPGEVLTSETRKFTNTSNRRPAEEPGVQPNARRVANLTNPGFLYIDEQRTDEKTASRTMQNSIRETATKFAPKINNTTVSAIIHLPYELERDDEGKTVQAVNELGEPLTDPETRLPMWKKKSITPLTQAELDNLKELIAHAAGIPIAEIPEKIAIRQVEWAAPVHSPVGADPTLIRFWKTLGQNFTAIVTFIFFAFALFFVYRYATRPIPTEIDEPIEQETISLAMTHDEEEEEMGDEEWDNLRSRVAAAVQEDPKRAANLLKRWMRKD